MFFQPCTGSRCSRAVQLVKNAHCNAANISDGRLVLFAGFRKRVWVFYLAIGSPDGMIGVTVLVFSGGAFLYPWRVCGFYRHHGTVMFLKNAHSKDQ